MTGHNHPNKISEILETLKEIEPFLAINSELRPDMAKTVGKLAKEGGEWLKILCEGLTEAIETAEPSLEKIIQIKARTVRKYYQALIKAGFSKGEAMLILLAKRQQSAAMFKSLMYGIQKAT